MNKQTETPEYLSFSIRRCAHWRDALGDLNTMELEPDAPEPDGIVGAPFWTVYGHTQDGEALAISDQREREGAEQLAQLLAMGSTIAQRNTEAQPCHYYVGTLLNWVVDEDLEVAIKKARREHKADHRRRMFKGPMDAWVWVVPGPVDSDYAINFYVPRKVGAFEVARLKF